MKIINSTLVLGVTLLGILLLPGAFLPQTAAATDIVQAAHKDPKTKTEDNHEQDQKTPDATQPERQPSIYDQINSPNTTPTQSPVSPSAPSSTSNSSNSSLPNLSATTSGSQAPAPTPTPPSVLSLLGIGQKPSPDDSQGKPSVANNNSGNAQPAASLLGSVLQHYSLYGSGYHFPGYMNAILLAGGGMFAIAGILFGIGAFDRYFA
jgi:cytoskeletal protein RodZ